MNLFEHGQIVPAIMPVDLSTAGVNGDFFDLSKYDGVNVLVFTSIGTAGDDVTIDFDQAQDAAATGVKALSTITTVYEKVGATAISGVGQFTKNTQAAGDTYTNATGAENQQLIGVYIKASELDTANGFTHVRVSTDDVGTNAQLGGAIYIGTGARYPQEPALSAIA